MGGLALAACARPTTYSQPEPGFLRYDTEDVLRAFDAAGLAAVNLAPRPIATATPVPKPFPQPKVKEPMIETEAFEFSIPALGSRGGSIFVFDSSERLRAKQIYFARYPDLFPYTYAHVNVLIVLDASLSPEQADQYRQALESLPDE